MRSKHYTKIEKLEILKAMEEGMKTPEAAEKYGVSEATLYNWGKMFRHMQKAEQQDADDEPGTILSGSSKTPYQPVKWEASPSKKQASPDAQKTIIALQNEVEMWKYMFIDMAKENYELKNKLKGY